MRHADRARSVAFSSDVFAALGMLSAAGMPLGCGDDGATSAGGASGARTPAKVSTAGATSSSSAATTTGGDGGVGGAGGATGGGGEGGVGTYVCPDGSTCEGSLCSLDPGTGAWGCVARGACQEERRCDGECCPTGSRCDDGVCPLPDLAIDRQRLVDSVEIQSRTFGDNACEIVEGCVDAPGRRRLLRFDLKTPNVGEGDLFLGKPADNEELFEYSSCHDHFHFTTYAAYRLLDTAGNVAATGHKQAFCLLDFEREDGATNAVYKCSYQGIQSGWSDVYDSYLPCQWVDVTDVPPGDYALEIRLNADRVLVESDYENDVVTVPAIITRESCPEGCPDWDDDVCRPGDPAGRAGDGACDCNGIFEWDAADCASCTSCATVSCPGGCEDGGPECCGAASDTCGLGGNGVCECSGATWDEADCAACISADEACEEIDSCPKGCGFSGELCDGFDEGSIADGWCDCTDEGWDTIDCFSCPSNCGQD